MGKVISLINTTPDGFADAKHVVVDAEFYDYSHGLLEMSRTVAFGRNTFEAFQNRWPALLEDPATPDWTRKMAKALHDKHKAVYSSTLRTTCWHNSSIVERATAEQIGTYKNDGQGGLLTLGSLNLVASLIEQDLVDEFYFCILPLIAGNGEYRLFDALRLDRTRPLMYVDSHVLKSGMHIIHYKKGKI
jgi:dihydrofolate reductase